MVICVVSGSDRAVFEHSPGSTYSLRHCGQKAARHIETLYDFLEGVLKKQGHWLG